MPDSFTAMSSLVLNLELHRKRERVNYIGNIKPFLWRAARVRQPPPLSPGCPGLACLLCHRYTERERENEREPERERERERDGERERSPNPSELLVIQDALDS